MASAARRACSGSLRWRGLNGIGYFNSTELIDDVTSAFTSLIGALSGAHGRLASESLVSCGGLMDVDDMGGAEQ